MIERTHSRLSLQRISNSHTLTSAPCNLAEECQRVPQSPACHPRTAPICLPIRQVEKGCRHQRIKSCWMRQGPGMPASGSGWAREEGWRGMAYQEGVLGHGSLVSLSLLTRPALSPSLALFLSRALCLSLPLSLPASLPPSPSFLPRAVVRAGWSMPVLAPLRVMRIGICICI